MKHLRGRYLAAIAGCMVALFISACGTSGGGTAASTATLTGSAGDGPIANGTVTVTDANGVVVATTTTDANAHYSVAVSSSAALPLTVTISGGTDLVTNQPPTFPLKSAVTTALSTVSDTTVNANPLTTIAVDTAVALGGVTTANLNTAITNVRNALGFGSDTTFNPISGTVASANVAATVKANEAVGEMIRRTVKASGDSVANVIGAIAGDLTDGTINGQQKAGVTVNALVTTKLAMQVQSTVAQVAAETMSNALTITDTSGNTVVTAANSLSALESAATTSNQGVTPTTTVANTPINASFIQQAKAAVAATINLAAATGVTTTALTSFQTTLNSLTPGTTAATAATTLGTTATSMNTETTSTATVATTATTTQLATATNVVTTTLNFKLSANTLTVQDYNGSNVALATFNVAGTVASGAMTANFGANTLNAANMSNLAQSTPTGTSPKFSFGLANIPVGSGTATVTALLKDGSSATRSAGQRMLQVVFDVDWSSDGTTLTLTAAAGTATATYYTAAGTAAVTATLTNSTANILSTGSSVGVTSSINAAIGNLFNTSGLGTALNSVVVQGNYYYQIDFSGFPLIDAGDNSLSTIQGTFTVQ